MRGQGRFRAASVAYLSYGQGRDLFLRMLICSSQIREQCIDGLGALRVATKVCMD